MSVNITINNAVKKYGDLTVIKNLDLKVKEGEFFTLLGPSGCGKTTLLRMIAGFNSIEGGDFYFNEKRINDLSPSNRNIGMVFQNYAIFPHMTVRRNVEFGLKNKKFPKDKIRPQTDEFLRLMQIDGLADRMPHMLSGGQQQRVALARALVIQPDVLLMDEPLSNLDAKLRVDMRSVIRRIQRDVGITTIYVTHDQEEAMAISDRIAVMHNGIIQHIGTPKEIYQRPANTFVATFIGRSNLLKGKLKKKDKGLSLEIGHYSHDVLNINPAFASEQDVQVSVRPEEFRLVEDGTENALTAVVEDLVFLGSSTQYFIIFEDGTQAITVNESTLDSPHTVGSTLYLQLNAEKINIFDADGNKNLLYGVSDGLKDEQEVTST